MKDKFAFLGDNKFKAAIAAGSLGVLLLLPASLGLWNNHTRSLWTVQPTSSGR